MKLAIWFACAICFGNRRNTSIEDGTIAAIAVLLGFIATVLLGIVGVILFWSRRARMLEQLGPAAGALPPIVASPKR